MPAGSGLCLRRCQRRLKMPANLVSNSWRLQEAWHLRSVQFVRIGRVEVQTIHNQSFLSPRTHCFIDTFWCFEDWIPSKVPTVLMVYQRRPRNTGHGHCTAESVGHFDSGIGTAVHAEIPLDAVRHILNAQFIRSESQCVGIIGTHRVRVRVKSFVC